MRSLIFLLLQTMAISGGSFLLWRLAKTGRAPKVFWLAAATLSICLGVALFLFIQPGRIFDDFRPVYWAAGNAVLVAPDQLMPLLRIGVDGGFVNLPIVAYAFAPLGLLPADFASWLFLVLGVGASLYAWWLAGSLFGFGRLERGISLLVLSGFGPLWYSLREGNSSHLLLVTLLLTIAALRKNKDFRAGLLLGITGVIKPPLLLICVYAAVRLRWGIVLGAALVIGGCAVASLAVFGLEANLVWYQTNIGTFAREPIAASNSHSIASVLARLHHGADVLSSWTPVHVPPEVRLTGLVLTALLALVAIYAAAPWERWFVTAEEFEADIVLIVSLSLFASTLTWTHYYSWLLLPAAWLWAQIRAGGYPRAAEFTLGGTMLICALAYVRWSPPEIFDFLLPWLFTYLLLGGLVLFGMLVWARRRIAVAARKGGRNSVLDRLWAD
nr:DUF2029 domain-containing protein [Pseudomonas sp.]